MPNTLTDLIPTIYQALDVVSRELVGLVPAVTRNTGAERAAKGQTILVPVTRTTTAIDITPGVTPPSGGNQTIDNIPIAITKARAVQVEWNGEQQLGMRNAGTYDTVLQDQFAQAFRTLTNEVEADIWAAAYQGASRAYGTAGTAPFGTADDLSDAANLAKVLDDNGTPLNDRHMVLGSAAVLNLRAKQPMLLKADQKGSDDFRRTGAISEVPLHGFMLHNSNAVRPITKGTGSGYLANGAVAAGVSDVVLDTGTGTVLAGDVVTFNGDTNKYVVNTTLGSKTANTLSIGRPGLLNALADNAAMTVGNNYTPNVGFHRSAIQLVARPPRRPMGPNGRPMDLATDVMLVTDPYSGLTFEVAAYPGFHQLTYYVGLAWGVAAIKSAHIATLIG